MDGKAVATDTIGGLTFTMMEEHDLAFDRDAYLAERDDDTMTVSTAPMYTGGKTPSKEQGDYFNARRQDYLNRGATPQTTDELPDELQRMPINERFDTSTDNLIQRPSYPPQYSSDMPPPVPRLPTSYSQQSFEHQSAVESYYGGGNGSGYQGMELTEQNTGRRSSVLPGMGYGAQNSNTGRSGSPYGDHNMTRSGSPYGAGAGYRNDGFTNGGQYASTPPPAQRQQQQQPQRLDDYLPPARHYQQRQYSSNTSTTTGSGQGAYPPARSVRNDQYSQYPGGVDGRGQGQQGQGRSQGQGQGRGNQQYYNEEPDEYDGGNAR